MLQKYLFVLIVSIGLGSILSLTTALSDDDDYLQNLSVQESRYNFKLWQLKHEKQYIDADEEAIRYGIYMHNMIHIKTLNEQHIGETHFAPNQFADMLAEEFKRTILMPSRPAPKHPKHKYLKSSTNNGSLPDTFDWRESGRVTPVKDQGSAGTCWAFSTVANIEGQYQRFYNKLVNLSVEQVVDCDDSKDPAKEYADCGVYGGWPYLAFGYLERQGGIEKESDYSYCAGGGKHLCFVCPNDWNSTLCGPPMPYCNMTQSCPYRLKPKLFVSDLKVVDWKITSQNETDIAYQLMDIGPLSVALDARMLQFYKSGVFNPFFCSKTTLDHAVLLVGFGTEKGVFGSTPYWLVKNSWGPSWGEKGYFKIKRGAATCGINTQVTTALLKH